MSEEVNDILTGIGIDEAWSKMYVGFFRRSGTACPNCQTEMLVGKGKPGERNHMDPFCPACHYSLKAGKIVEKSDPYSNAAKWQASAHRKKAMDYYSAFNVFSNAEVSIYKMANFQKTDGPKLKMYQAAEKILRDFRDGKTIHAIFMGPTGVGKTHIAHGLLMAAMAATSYEKKGFFLDWQEYISLTRDAIGGTQEVKRHLVDLQKEIERADIIVLDDIGTERDTDYSADHMDRFWRKREDKTVIVTTNCSMDDLEDRYAARVVGRMKKHGRGYGYRAPNEMENVRETPF